MEKHVKNTIAISGATGFVGKNLTKYFDQNKTKYTSITRTALQRKKLLSLPRCFSMVHLAGVGVETVEKSFQEVNIELTKKLSRLVKNLKLKKLFILVVLEFQRTRLLSTLYQNSKLNK